jgi:probable rRNA maturation factor
VDEALIQARRFRTTWQNELLRYIIHGVLHLGGFDDERAASRRRMKREEDRLLGKLARDFDLSKLRRKPTVRA